jgi:hypothetical protein
VARVRLPAIVATSAIIAAIGCGGSPLAPSLPPTLPETLPFIATPPIPAGVSPTIAGMLSRLAGYIRSAYLENRDLLPRNSHLATQINAKMAMLAVPNLINQIFDGRRWAEGSAPTVTGGVTPIGALFPLEEMRAECTEAIRTLETILPILVNYFGEPFPTGRLELWYGFTVGASGGGGTIYIADRTTSNTVNPNSLITYEATLAHEASHSYISNEALTQFLEVYIDNVRRGRGLDPLGWDFTRGWTPTTPSTFGVTFVLDVYFMVGPEVMQKAYRAILPLRPAYGQPLSQPVLDAFVAQVPEPLRAAVRAKLGQIIA